MLCGPGGIVVIYMVSRWESSEYIERWWCAGNVSELCFQFSSGIIRLRIPAEDMQLLAPAKRGYYVLVNLLTNLEGEN
jgi:hypothetical protein